jgi:hypothetical protein
MAGVDIQNKVKAGLRKATIKTGDGTSLIYLNKKVRTAGTPITPPTETVTPILLVDAIVKQYDRKLIDNDLIRGGDKRLVVNGDVDIVQNDEVDVNGIIHAVIDVEVCKPSNVSLAYQVQIRRQ